MPLPHTETRNRAAVGLDARPLPEAAALLLRGHQAALDAVAAALDPISAAAAAMADALGRGGRLVYGGAGSSALMAMADATELGGTFGVPPGQVAIRMAGGLPVDARMPGASEDDRDQGRRDGADLTARDLLIVASASGRTPYALGLAEAAASAGAAIVAIANNPDTPLLLAADIAVCLPTPPEMVAGSTRLGAGTAQKTALNIMSTLMGIRLGQVHDGLMVGVVADNAKLRARAAGMVAEIAGVPAAAAARSLDAADGAVKPAVLIAAGLADAARATELLAEAQGNLRAAMARLAGRGQDPETQAIDTKGRKT